MISHPCLFQYPKMWARAWWAGAYDVTAGQPELQPGLLEGCGLSSLWARSGNDLRGVWATGLHVVARCVHQCVCARVRVYACLWVQVRSEAVESLSSLCRPKDAEGLVRCRACLARRWKVTEERTRAVLGTWGSGSLPGAGGRAGQPGGTVAGAEGWHPYPGVTAGQSHKLFSSWRPFSKTQDPFSKI